MKTLKTIIIEQEGPPNYRTAESCSSCGNFDDMKYTCSKFNKNVGSDAVCDAWEGNI